MATYTDDFNRPDSTNIGNWTEVDDDFSIISNQLAPGVSTVGLAIYNTAVDTDDNYAEIVLSNATASSMGVFARSDASGSNFYLWRSNGADPGDNWTLFSNIEGAFTSLGSYSAPAVNGDVARIECVGDTIKGYVNGVERVSVVNTDIPAGKHGGVRSEASSTARYDNFIVSDVGSPSPAADPGAFFDFMS